MTEWLDILTEQGEPTGERRPREDVHRLGLWHRTVHIWAFNPRGEVLLQQRSLAKDSYPGYWDTSAAGHISAGQTSLEAAQREFSEELGLFLAKDRFLWKAVFPEVHSFSKNHFLYLDQEFHDTYWVNLNPEEIECLKFESVEVSDLRWITPAQLWTDFEYKQENLVPHPESYALLRAC